MFAVTGPVQRFARSIAGQGYIVAAPSSYHEFMGPEPLAYDGPGTDVGNAYKVQKVWLSLLGSCFKLSLGLKDVDRKSLHTMKTPVYLSTHCLRCQHAVAGLALRVCVLVAISRTEQRWIRE